jgi:hypothetical protein
MFARAICGLAGIVFLASAAAASQDAAKPEKVRHRFYHVEIGMDMRKAIQSLGMAKQFETTTGGDAGLGIWVDKKEKLEVMVCFGSSVVTEVRIRSTEVGNEKPVTVDDLLGKAKPKGIALRDSERGLFVRVISVNDDWSEDRNPPVTIRYRGKGKFLGIDGGLAFGVDALARLLQESKDDEKPGRRGYLLIDVRKGTPLDELVDILNRLRAATPADTNALIWIRVDGLNRLSPPRK